MAAFSSIAAGIGALAAVGSGIAGNVQQNKARGQARYQMHLQMQEAQKQRELARQQFDAKLAEDARIHRENMQHQRAALEANQRNFAAQHAQAMQEQKIQADRQMAVQQANLERSINSMTDRPQTTFKRPDMGVAGTILTNPLGVGKDKIKKGTTVLGGV